jgi:hypothetical protein
MANSPRDVRSTAGTNFRQYGIAHGGLGVWDKTTDYKFSIEYTSESYVGALIPECTDTSGRLLWNNTGQITFTAPMQAADWHTSQLICETTGVAYNQLVSYLSDHSDVFAVYQPVEAVFYRNESGSSQHTVLEARDSFWFVGLLVSQLSSYGADTDAFLDVYATAYQYVVRTALPPEVVSWPAQEAASADVCEWYRRLDACYRAVYNATDASEGGADYFLQVSCTRSAVMPFLTGDTCVALYRRSKTATATTPTCTSATPACTTSLWATSAVRTPRRTCSGISSPCQTVRAACPPALNFSIVQSLRSCGRSGSDDRERDLQPVDIVLIVVVALATLCGVLVLLRTVCTKVRLCSYCEMLRFGVVRQLPLRVCGLF